MTTPQVPAPDVEAEIRDIRQRLERLGMERAEAVARRDQAQADIRAVAAQLHAEFGVSSEAEALALLGSLRTQVTTGLAHIRAELDAVGS